MDRQEVRHHGAEVGRAVLTAGYKLLSEWVISRNGIPRVVIHPAGEKHRIS
jgi:hypothetical protein